MRDGVGGLEPAWSRPHRQDPRPPVNMEQSAVRARRNRAWRTRALRCTLRRRMVVFEDLTGPRRSVHADPAQVASSGTSWSSRSAARQPRADPNLDPSQYVQPGSAGPRRRDRNPRAQAQVSVVEQAREEIVQTVLHLREEGADHDVDRRRFARCSKSWPSNQSCRRLRGFQEYGSQDPAPQLSEVPNFGARCARHRRRIQTMLVGGVPDDSGRRGGPRPLMEAELVQLREAVGTGGAPAFVELEQLRRQSLDRELARRDCRDRDPLLCPPGGR